MSRILPILALISVCTLFSGVAASHEIRPAIVTLTIAQDGSYSATVNTNLEVMLAGIGPEHKDTDDAPSAVLYKSLRQLAADDLRHKFQSYSAEWLAGLRLEFDGHRSIPQITRLDIPDPGDLDVARLSLLHLSGTMPPDARSVRWTYEPKFGASILRVKLPDSEKMITRWLKDGTPSDAIPLKAPARQTIVETIIEYMVLGFTHILPGGLDHILFVLGLYFLSTRWRPLLIQVTAFTIAHSITLGLGLYGVVAVSPAIVEPLIAISIAYVAVENMVTQKLSVWRPFIVFGFGLLHGLGFAGVLQEIGLPRDEYITGLIAFNIGVEGGQLATIALAFMLVGYWWRDRSWYRLRVVFPACALIGVTGLYWTIERIFFT